MSQTPSLGDVVVITEFGKSFAALVVKTRVLDHHLGQNDEPLVSAIGVKPLVLDECIKCHFAERYHGKPYSPGAPNKPCDDFEGRPAPESSDILSYANVVNDVPHESHEFTQAQLDALQKQGITVGQVYPGGRVEGSGSEAKYVAGRIPGPRWRDITSTELEGLLNSALVREKEAAKKAAAAQVEQAKAPGTQPAAGDQGDENGGSGTVH